MLATSMYMEVRKQAQLVQYREDQLARLADLEDKLDRMRSRVDFYKTEEGKAWIARDKLNMALPGEEIYKIDDSSQPPARKK